MLTLDKTKIMLNGNFVYDFKSPIELISILKQSQKNEILLSKKKNFNLFSIKKVSSGIPKKIYCLKRV